MVQPENLKKVNVFEENEKRNLSITLVMSCGFPFKLKCRLSRVSDEMVCMIERICFVSPFLNK